MWLKFRTVNESCGLDINKPIKLFEWNLVRFNHPNVKLFEELDGKVSKLFGKIKIELPAHRRKEETNSRACWRAIARFDFLRARLAPITYIIKHCSDFAKPKFNADIQATGLDNLFACADKNVIILWMD